MPSFEVARWTGRAGVTLVTRFTCSSFSGPQERQVTGKTNQDLLILTIRDSITRIDWAKYVIWYAMIWCCMMYASERIRVWTLHCFSASWTLLTGSPSLQEKGSQKHSKACSSQWPSKASCTPRRFDGKAVLTQMWGEICRRGFGVHTTEWPLKDKTFELQLTLSWNMSKISYIK